MLAADKFLSTPSARRATSTRSPPGLSSPTFLSTPSARRATGAGLLLSTCKQLFLSTPSARRATANKEGKTMTDLISIHALREEGDAQTTLDVKHIQTISIHALREEGDTSSAAILWRSISFLSTPSARRATHALCQPCARILFLSTPSARRATFPLPVRPLKGRDFYPRPPRGGRPESRCRSGCPPEFLSTPSARRAT